MNMDEPVIVRSVGPLPLFSIVFFLNGKLICIPTVPKFNPEGKNESK